MNSFEQIHALFHSFLQNTCNITENFITASTFTLNTDLQQQQFGDISSNIALLAAKQRATNPRQLATEIAQQFSHPLIERIEVAGPGFLNFFMTETWFITLAQELATQRDAFFTTQPATPKNINVEFVSANPTGPLHIGHGRNAILGDVLATLHTFLNQKVSREFYINDAGSQITKLGQSFKVRCLQQLGQNIPMPEDGYQGSYLIDLATTCSQTFGKNLEHEPALFFETYAQKHMIAQQQATLESYGVVFQTWFSEKQLHDQGKVAQALQMLTARGHTYEHEGALWFRSTTFGDDKDRVLKKADGQLTYVAADIAYLINKFERGFTDLVLILGHDHHSYKTRLLATAQALGYDPSRLTIILYQLVQVLQDGVPVKMSKRTGQMITLSDLINEAGKDVTRFFFLNRKADAELEFDLTLALKQSNENPVFYIQYAYVRTGSIFAKAAMTDFLLLQTQTMSAPTYQISLQPEEKLLLKKIVSLKYLLTDIAQNHQVHLIAHYAYDLANLFHQYYNNCRIVDPMQQNTSVQRLHIVQIVQNTLLTLFYLMGITPMKKM